MVSPITEKKLKAKSQTATPWRVIVLDDPVNLQHYVTMVIKKVFGYSQSKADSLMMEVHNVGRSVVWTGTREKAEFYVQQLHLWQLQATMERSV